MSLQIVHEIIITWQHVDVPVATNLASVKRNRILLLFSFHDTNIGASVSTCIFKLSSYSVYCLTFV